MTMKYKDFRLPITVFMLERTNEGEEGKKYKMIKTVCQHSNTWFVREDDDILRSALSRLVAILRGLE